jgi:hypothetical protein
MRESTTFYRRILRLYTHGFQHAQPVSTRRCSGRRQPGEHGTVLQQRHAFGKRY